MTVQADRVVLYGLTDINDPTSLKPVLIDAQGRIVSDVSVGTVALDAASLAALENITVTPVAGGATAAGAAHTATGQVTATTTAGTAIAARATRRNVTFVNTHASISVYIGPATVTAANGFLLVAGAGRDFRSIDLLQVIAASGTPVVAYVEEYD